MGALSEGDTPLLQPRGDLAETLHKTSGDKGQKKSRGLEDQAHFAWISVVFALTPAGGGRPDLPFEGWRSGKEGRRSLRMEAPGEEDEGLEVVSPYSPNGRTDVISVTGGPECRHVLFQAAHLFVH